MPARFWFDFSGRRHSGYDMKTSIILLLALLPALLFADPDVRKLSWGMSRTEAMAIEGKAVEANGYISYPRELGRTKFQMGLAFYKDQLASVMYLNVEVSPSSIISEYDRLLEILTEKYGKPSKGGDIWLTGRAGDVDGIAITTGMLKRGQIWELPNTTITLMAGDSSPLKCRLVVMYQSSILKAQKEKDDRKKASDDL